MPPKDNRFRTLDLIGAQNFGWDQHRGVSQAQSQILVFIAKQGKMNEPGMAFAWFPLWGQEWWANLMVMKPVTLRTSLHKLRENGLLVNLSGSAKDPRFTFKRGYGIPLKVMEECRQWHDDHVWMLRFRAPDTLEECSTVEHPCNGVEHRTSSVEHRTPHSPTPISDSELHTHKGLPERETRRLTSASSPPGGSQSPPQGEPVKNQGDGWDQPQDEADQWAAPRQEKSTPYHRPSTRLADQFYDCWLVSREARTDLPVAWSVKSAFLKNLKRMLEDSTEEEISGRITEFFRLVDQRQIAIKTENLWVDFLYYQGKVVKLAQGRTPVLTAEQEAAQERAIAEHNRQVMGGLA